MTIPLVPELPMDLIEEILCYVPPTHLKRLSSTCKRWNRLINCSWRFARKHKAAKQFLVIMLTKQSRICPVNINLHDRSVDVKSELNLPDPHDYSYQFHIKEVFHCDGFLLCTYDCKSRVVVWNPFTGETRWFRSSNKDHSSFVLGYDNSSSYKLLSYHYCGDNCEIYDFNADSWRVLDGSIIPLEYCIRYPMLSRVSLKGNTYWFAIEYIETLRRFSLSLLKFDFSTEKAVPVPLPYQFIGFEARCLSVVRDEKLSVLLKRDKRSKTEIWVTNKIDETTKVVSWSKVLALNLSPDLKISDYGTFLLDEEKKVFVYCNRWLDLKEKTCYSTTKVVIYIVGEDNKVTKKDFERDTWGVCSPAILNYVPSLAQLKQAGGKKKRGDSCD